MLFSNGGVRNQLVCRSVNSKPVYVQMNGGGQSLLSLQEIREKHKLSDSEFNEFVVKMESAGYKVVSEAAVGRAVKIKTVEPKVAEPKRRRKPSVSK